MKIRRTIAIALFFAALPLYADFSAVVREVQSRTGLHRVYVPFLGLARFAVWIIHPKGVHDIELATFEGNSHDTDGRFIGDLLLKNAGPGFRPLVRVQSNKHGGEWTYIYARPTGELFELMIATYEGREATVVHAVVDIERMQQTMNDGKHGRVMASLR